MAVKYQEKDKTVSISQGNRDSVSKQATWLFSITEKDSRPAMDETELSLSLLFPEAVPALSERRKPDVWERM